jgi:2'-5' RNA ligase
VPSTNLLRQNHEKEAEVVKIEDSKKFQHQPTPKVAWGKQNKTNQKLKMQQEINVKMNEATLRKLLKANSKED